MEDIPQPGSLEAEAGIFCSTFDRTGTRLITGGADKTIKVRSDHVRLIASDRILLDLRRTDIVMGHSSELSLLFAIYVDPCTFIFIKNHHWLSSLLSLNFGVPVSPCHSTLARGVGL